MSGPAFDLGPVASSITRIPSKRTARVVEPRGRGRERRAPGRPSGTTAACGAPSSSWKVVGHRARGASPVHRDAQDPPLRAARELHLGVSGDLGGKPSARTDRLEHSRTSSAHTRVRGSAHLRARGGHGRRAVKLVPGAVSEGAARRGRSTRPCAAAILRGRGVAPQPGVRAPSAESSAAVARSGVRRSRIRAESELLGADGGEGRGEEGRVLLDEAGAGCETDDHGSVALGHGHEIVTPDLGVSDGREDSLAELREGRHQRSGVAGRVDGGANGVRHRRHHQAGGP